MAEGKKQGKKGTGPGRYKVFTTTDGNAVFMESKIGRDDAVKKALQEMFLQKDERVQSRPFNQGRVDQLYPWGDPSDPIQRGRERSYYDISPSGPLDQWIPGGGPRHIMHEAEGGELLNRALSPETALTWQDVVNVFGEGTTLEGSSETAPLDPIAGTQYQNPSDLSTGQYSMEQLKALASFQGMTGMTPLTNPSMFPGGMTSTESDMVKLGDIAYQDEIINYLPSMEGTKSSPEMRLGVDFQSPFDTTYTEDMAVFDRIGLFQGPPNRQRLASILNTVIKESGNSPDFETFITPDPGHPNNTFLWARRSPSDTWNIVDFGIWEEMLASGPRMLGATAGAVASNIHYGKALGALGRAFPWKAGKDTVQSLGAKVYDKLTSPGISKAVGRGTASAAGAVSGEMVAAGMEELALSKFRNQKALTWEERLHEAQEIVGTNVLGEAAGGLLIAGGKMAFSPAIRYFAVAPDAFQGAARASERYNGPPMRSWMLSAISRMRGRRVMALTSFGQRKAQEAEAQGLIAYKNFRDDMGGLFKMLKPGGDAVRAAVGSLSKMTGKRFGEVINLVQHINQSMSEAMLKKTNINSNLPPREWGEIMTSLKGTLQEWNYDMQETFVRLSAGLDGQFSNLGAHWDLSPLRETISSFRQAQKTYVPIDPKTGKVYVDPKTNLIKEKDWGAGIVEGSDLDVILKEIETMPPSVDGPGSYSTLRQFKARMDNIEPANLSTETELLGKMKRTLNDILMNPQGMPTDPAQQGAVREVMGELGKFQEGYKSFKETETMFQAHIMKSGFTPEEIGRGLINAQEQPTLIRALRKAFGSDTKGFDELRQGYVQTLIGGDPDKLLKLLRHGGVDKPSREAIEMMLPRELRADLAEYAQLKKFIMQNEASVDVLGNVTRAGKSMTNAWETGDRAAFDASLSLLKTVYPDDWQQVAAWGILDNVLMGSQSIANNKLVLNKEVIRKRLTSLRTKGIFSEILSEKDMANFDDMLSLITYLPDTASGDVALGMSGQTLAKETMLISNPLRPVSTIKGRFDVVTNAINARWILDGWLAAPTGLSRGRVTIPAMKTTLGHLISSEKKINDMGKRYHPGRYSEGGAEAKLNDIIEANLIFVPGGDRGLLQDHPSRGMQEMERQAQEIDRLQMMWQRAPAWERRRMEAQDAAPRMFPKASPWLNEWPEFKSADSILNKGPDNIPDLLKE